jgi:hypothetical protein
MQELSPVGLSKDGKRLVLVSTSGEEYTVIVDHHLRAALRGDNARLGQLEMKMQSALRPRDIQARIRAGESPEQVAAAAQTTVEAIMGFATPVLAERAHIAQVAQRSSVRRRSAESSSSARTLGDAAAANLRDLGIAEDEVDWDAWRREDGRWTLVADFREHHAEFSYDQPGRYVTAENDDARLMTGELRKAAPAQGSTGRRLSAVPDQDELPLGDDAIELVRERDLAVPRPAAADEPGPEAPAARDAADQETTEQETAEQAAEQETAEQAAGPSPASDPSSAPAAADPAAPARDETTPGPAEEPAEPSGEADDRPEPPTRSKRKGRASVPSWDEIMFGGGRSE